jgi:hypothetical protein
MRYLILLLMLALQPVWAVTSDYAREKKWADEIVPGVVVGDPVYLEAQGQQFLTLYTEAPNAKAGLVIVHGIGVHPDHGLIGVLRSRLADLGYTTLSIQMPILAVDAEAGSYQPLFPEAAARIQAAAKFLQDKGNKKIAIVSHSLGSAMTKSYFQNDPDSPFSVWVAIGLSSDNYGGVKLPIFDLYGGNDLPAVVKGASGRKATLTNSKSEQTMAPKMDHFFTGYDDDLVNYVSGYLDKSL